MTEAFRRALLLAFARRQLLTKDAVHSMLEWPHSGFHVHHAVRLEADDAAGILQLARYAARLPVALQRLHYDARKRRVTLVSGGVDAAMMMLDSFSAAAPVVSWGRSSNLARVYLRITSGSEFEMSRFPAEPDTSTVGLIVGGIVAAASGHLDAARRNLRTVQHRPAPDRRRYAVETRLLEGWIGAVG